MIISINFGSTKFTLDVNPSDSILDIKYLIHEEKGISPFSQKLLYQDESLEDEKTLSDYNIQNLSILHLLNSPADDPIVQYEELVSRLIEGNATVRDYAGALSYFLFFSELFTKGWHDIAFKDDDRIKIIELSFKFSQFRESYDSQTIEYMEKGIIKENLISQEVYDFLILNGIEAIKEEEEEDEDNEKVDAGNDKDNEDGKEDETNGNDDTGDDKDNEDGDEDEVNGKDDSGDDNNEEEGDGEDNIQETLN